MYASHYICLKVLATFDVCDGSRVKFVMTEVTIGRDSMIFCVFYRPPKKPAPREFFDKLNAPLPHHDKIVITGDFNSNMFDYSCPYAKFLYNNLQLHSLHPVLLLYCALI